MNIANQVTISRLFFSALLFVLLAIGETKSPSSNIYQILLDSSLLIFFIAAATDALDGYLARKYDLRTVFGRIADPLVDKITICGTFVFLIKLTPLVQPWMAVTIIAREFLVSGIRGYMESQGRPFAANIWGKSKMMAQCITIAAILFYLAHLQLYRWAYYTVVVMIWLTILLTAFSALIYVYKAYRSLNGELK